MKGISIVWSRRREEHMAAFLTFDQVRARFGLGGTIDKLVRRRMGQVATQAEIIAAAEELADPHMNSASSYQIVRLDYRETDEGPDPDPGVCCTCGQPIPPF